MHGNLDRLLGRAFKSIWFYGIPSVIMLAVFLGICTSLLYWAVLIIKLAWTH